MFLYSNLNFTPKCNTLCCIFLYIVFLLGVFSKVNFFSWAIIQGFSWERVNVVHNRFNFFFANIFEYCSFREKSSYHFVKIFYSSFLPRRVCITEVSLYSNTAQFIMISKLKSIIKSNAVHGIIFTKSRYFILHSFRFFVVYFSNNSHSRFSIIESK